MSTRPTTTLSTRRTTHPAPLQGSCNTWEYFGHMHHVKPTTATDTQLWQDAAAGNQSAFAELFERHVEAVWNHAYRLTTARCWPSAATRSATVQARWRSETSVRLGAAGGHPAWRADPVPPPIGWGPQDQHTVLGLLRNDVASVELRGPGDARIPVILGNGGFSATVSGVGWEDLSTITAVVRDASGAELYRGPVIG